MLLNPAGHRAALTPLTAWGAELDPPCPVGPSPFTFFPSVFPLILFFHGAKSLPRAPPSLLGVTTTSPIPFPATRGDWDPLGMSPPHCHPVPAALRARAELWDRNKH